MIIHYRFPLETTVKIKELGLKGRVISVWTGRRGSEYEVRFCSNGKYENIYFYDDELEAINDQPK